MKNLIYLCTFGSAAYARMTALCIHSLRTLGRFEGDIIVFSDGTFEDTRPDIEIVRLPRLESIFEIKIFKTRAAEYFDPGKYRKIVGMDVDIIAIRDINPLFDMPGNGMSCMQEIPFNTMSSPSCGGTLSLKQQFLGCFFWGFNSGVYCVNAELLSEYMGLWRNAIVENQHRLAKWVDQPALNALIFNKKIKCIPYPPGWIEMPPMYVWFGGRMTITDQTKLLHFCWADKERCLRDMTASLRTYEQAQTA